MGVLGTVTLMESFDNDCNALRQYLFAITYFSHCLSQVTRESLGTVFCGSFLYKKFAHLTRRLRTKFL